MIIFKCEHCYHLFWYSSQLKSHLEEHFKEKNFVGAGELYYTFYDFRIKNKHSMIFKRKLTKKEKDSIKEFNKELRKFKEVSNDKDN